MKKLPCAASLTALMVGGAAIPAHAQIVFADINGAQVHWARSTTGPVTGTFTVTGNNYIDFSVANLPDLPTHLLAQLQITASEAGIDGTATAVSASRTDYDQGGIAGSFNEVYEGPSGTYDGVTLVQGETVLLSGAVTNGDLSAGKTVRGSRTTYSSGDLFFEASGFASPYLNFGVGVNESLDFTIASGPTWGVSPRLYNAVTTTTLNSFAGTATGQFESESVVSASVFEPAGWMLILGGVGLTGGVLRRRRVAGLPA
jgi:hypothetical protein